MNFATADWLEWGFKAAARYRDFKHLSAFSVTKLLFQVVQAPLERKLEDGLEAMELLEQHTLGGRMVGYEGVHHTRPVYQLVDVELPQAPGAPRDGAEVLTSDISKDLIVME